MQTRDARHSLLGAVRCTDSRRGAGRESSRPSRRTSSSMRPVPAIAIFAPAHVRMRTRRRLVRRARRQVVVRGVEGGGAHGDAALLERVRRVADYLVGLQDADGYLGNYAPERRFMRKQPPKPVTLGRRAARAHVGHLDAQLPDPRAARSASAVRDQVPISKRRAGSATCVWRTLTSGGIDITDLGNHHGMSATVLMDPALELHFATGERRYLDLALRILEQAERNPRLALLTQALAGADASEIATGKAYQLSGTCSGSRSCIARRATRRTCARSTNVWRNIRDHHLTLGGGPWGGVAHRSREVFNPAGGVQSVRLRRDVLDARVDSAQSRAARDHRRGRVRGGNRAQRLQRSARRAGAGRRGLVLLLLPERPARAHDLLALLQVERRDGARRIAVARVRDAARTACRVNLLGPSEATLQRAGCRRCAAGAAHGISVRRRSCDSRRAGAHGDVRDSRARFRSGPRAPAFE